MSRDAAADVPRTRSRRRSFAHLAAGFLIGSLFCLGLAGAALYVWDAGYEGRVLAGVRSAASTCRGSIASRPRPS